MHSWFTRRSVWSEWVWYSKRNFVFREFKTYFRSKNFINREIVRIRWSWKEDFLFLERVPVMQERVKGNVQGLRQATVAWNVNCESVRQRECLVTDWWPNSMHVARLFGETRCASLRNRNATCYYRCYSVVNGREKCCFHRENFSANLNDSYFYGLLRLSIHLFIYFIFLFYFILFISFFFLFHSFNIVSNISKIGK